MLNMFKKYKTIMIIHLAISITKSSASEEQDTSKTTYLGSLFSEFDSWQINPVKSKMI